MDVGNPTESIQNPVEWKTAEVLSTECPARAHGFPLRKGTIEEGLILCRIDGQ